ncbi:semaphorin-5A-like [Centruroides sculpturatus]|uniref:semaphorin-5A-like n=1 Tax=Centruroides sculpturatus TaxID=218467 RepID=UPI000C6CD57B|nr:semaphorin-5A-like [Centruroides sculpturatus]XP_023224678.1 semaphorin-5A-like [Centruroides sculpturatus]XP_023224685.1 semaphorin-5A-like [Centruroides sculpturatus]
MANLFRWLPGPLLAAALFCLWPRRSESVLPEGDFRVISYSDLQKSMDRFSRTGVSAYTELLFDIPHYQLIVGARDNLFRLTLETLEKLEETYWPSPENTILMCIQKGQTKEDCKNFIRVLTSYNGKIFTCGTNAFSPKCSWRDINSLNTVIEWVSGVAKCPYSPHHNSTALMTVQGDYYIASAVDFSAQDHAIYRIMGKGPILRTVQYDPKWLNEPHFVASYEIENYVYFFFRETAVEFINCGKTIYSRIARICKNDQGGQFILKDNWTTFLKARLNCSIPGQYPFYYNEIQSVYYLEKEQMIYATFSTNENSIYGSAICSYNLTAIHRSFNGPFKYQSNPMSSWEKQTNAQKHFQCETFVDSQALIDSEKYQLMDNAVQPSTFYPIYNIELDRLSHMVVDVVPTKNDDGIHVIFVVNVDGLLRKLALSPLSKTACLIEEIHLFPSNSSFKIHTMKLLKDTNSIYLGTSEAVFRISLHRCDRFKSKNECLSAMDPYCGWNEHQLSCTVAPHRNPKVSFWIQNSIECPRTDRPVDGNWGPWSAWYECAQVGSNSPGDMCFCQQRSCNNPSPSNGGKPCTGIKFQVTNCTQNGQWSDWSAWSSCSQTCGNAVKTRKRTCGNPAPAYGGRVCIGTDREELYCNNPSCPEPSPSPIDGQWSEWSSWEECNVPCGGGIQSRQRNCNNPFPQYGGRECLGCNQEYRHCNTHECPEVRKVTNWTPWLKLNITRDGYFEQRFRFPCRCNVPNSNDVRIGHMKKEERFCVEGGSSCLDAAFANIDGDWSEWSSWSECSASCNGGIQYRERTCDNPVPSGTGHECKDISKMERECNKISCEALAGWEEWSGWSICDEKKEQYRERKCKYTAENPNQCQGLNKEIRICILGQIGMSRTSSSGGGVNPGYVATAGVCCFIAGCLAGAAAVYLFLKRRNSEPRTTLGNLAKSRVENIYVDERVNNFNANGSNGKNNQQATIKRQKSLRTNFQDNNF